MKCIQCKNHHFLGIVDNTGIFIMRHRKRCITIEGVGSVIVTCDRCGESVQIDIHHCTDKNKNRDGN